MRKRGGTQLFCTHEPATSQTVTHPGISFSVIPVFYVAVLLETPILVDKSRVGSLLCLVGAAGG